MGTGERGALAPGQRSPVEGEHDGGEAVGGGHEAPVVGHQASASSRRRRMRTPLPTKYTYRSMKAATSPRTERRLIGSMALASGPPTDGGRCSVPPQSTEQ